jgi:3',5'-cyclic AMP phosphodiesterase CpdA
MKDYEKKFYMPMKGVAKPVYAIPGNHDWYDALEGFAANFYDSAAARKAMQARINKDLKISSTTQEKIDDMIAEASFLRKEYRVPTGYQQAPYFQVGNEQFVLLCIDTGVKRQVDSLELVWVKNVLENSKGKFVMALLGHPFYAIGEYQGSLNPEFQKLHELLRSYKVPVVMAGDTHDLEYYVEQPRNNDGHTMYHFVNGGGGAYLSIGTAMAKAESMPTRDYAFYPSYDPLVKKIEANTSWYKYPAWWYTKKFDGWPFSAEWLSAAFDYNVAPFFQSFMEIRVERSTNKVRFIPYSQHGRLKWGDITSTEGARPNGVGMDDLVEWIMPLKQ